jgi:hypothetical protein
MVLIPSNINLPLNINSPATQNFQKLLTVGQVFSANIQPTKGNLVQISIGNQTFVATSKQPITESGTVQLRVKQLVPELQLSIVKPSTSESKQTTQLQILQASYRQFMPNQMPISQSFQQISLLQSLPPSLQVPINNLISQLLKQEQNLDGKTLKDKFSNSGLFLESKLKNLNNGKNVNLNNDVKAQILKLQQQLTSFQPITQGSALSKLSELLTQALSRITVQQLQLFESPGVSALYLPSERPKTLEEDQIEIRKQQLNQKTYWEVYIDLNLSKGAFSSKVKLSDDDKLDCYIWCESDELNNLVSSHLETLKNLFSSKSYESINIQLVSNRPVKSSQSQKVALIDISV